MENFGYALFLSFLKKLNLFVDTVFPAFMETFGTWAYSLIVLYLVIVSIDLMLTHKIIKTWEQSIEFIISIIFAVALLAAMKDNFGLYKEWVINPVISTTIKLSSFFISTINDNLIAGTGVKSLFQSLDALSYKIFDFMLNIKLPGGISNLVPLLKAGIAGILLLASFAGAYTVFLVLLILGFFSLYVLFTVGGICIFLAPFSKTRFIFFAWLRAVINYALVIVFTSIIMSICYFGLNQELTALIALKGSGSLFTTQYLSALCWSILTFAVLLKGPDFAAALSGGQAGSTSGIAAGVGMAASAMVGGGAYAMKKGIGGVGSGLGKINNMYKEGRNAVPDLSTDGRAFSKMKGL